MTDKDLARLQMGIYGEMPGWDDFFEVAGVVVGIKTVDGVTVIVLRGSVTPLDFMRDLRVVADPFKHDGLGPVHPGFMRGMSAVWKAVKETTEGSRVVIGHSLGAARAAILDGLMTLDGQPPIARVVWGEPLSGFQQLADLIGKKPVHSYRNGNKHGHDPITDLPLSGLVERYVRSSLLIDICATPNFSMWPTDDWHRIQPIGWHDMAMYEKATPSTEITIPKLQIR